jgi:uncharacterized iron-regulated membrane protein
MSRALLLRLHRWIALTFTLPSLVIVCTGLILSFEPLVNQSAIQPGSVTAQTVEGLLHRHDPQSTARSLFLRPHERTISINGRNGSVEIDLNTGQQVPPGTRTLSDLFGAARRVHERLIFGASWLVIASTVAMLVLPVFGILMGWPRLRNTLAGWHKALGWLPLPLVVLSPLTGLLLALGVTFAPSTPVGRLGPPLPLMEAVRVLGASHDLSSLSWIRPFGETLVARIAEDGELKTYAILRDGAVPDARNWPRLIHEGTWGGFTLAILNLVTSLALLGLLATGAWIWVRRKFRRSERQRLEAKGALSGRR